MKGSYCSRSEQVFWFCDGVSLTFNECVSRYEKLIYSVSLNMLGNVAEAEEVMARVFLSVTANLSDSASEEAEQVLSEEAFRKQLIRETLSQAAEILERRSYAALQLTVSLEEEGSQKEAVTSSSVISHLQKLPFEYRKVFVLRDCVGFSLNDICEVLSVSLEDVRARLRRARLMLRRGLVRDWVSLQAIRQMNATGQAENVPQLLV